MAIENYVLDRICQPVILKVKEHLEQEMLLSHLDYNLEKHIYLHVGEIAFACSLWQITPEGKREFVEFWSKKWNNNINSYSLEEKYSLATRESLKH